MPELLALCLQELDCRRHRRLLLFLMVVVMVGTHTYKSHRLEGFCCRSRIRAFPSRNTQDHHRVDYCNDGNIHGMNNNKTSPQTGAAAGGTSKRFSSTPMVVLTPLASSSLDSSSRLRFCTKSSRPWRRNGAKQQPSQHSSNTLVGVRTKSGD